MPIPTAEDRKLADLDDRHGGIMTRLRVLRYAAKPRKVGDLREQLQQYADAAIAFVNELD
jgi:hypothetical protein